MYLNENSNDLVDSGYVSVFRKKALSEAKISYQLSKAKKTKLPDIDWIEGKKRHLWVHDVPNTGKTTMVKQLSEKASLYWKDLTDPKFFDQYIGQQFICFNDFSGQIPIASLKTWTDGGLLVSVKGSVTTLHNQVVFIITSNKSIQDTFSEAFGKDPSAKVALEARFLEIDAKDFYEYLKEKELIPEFL